MAQCRNCLARTNPDKNYCETCEVLMQEKDTLIYRRYLDIRMHVITTLVKQRKEKNDLKDSKSK